MVEAYGTILLHVATLVFPLDEKVPPALSENHKYLANKYVIECERKGLTSEGTLDQLNKLGCSKENLVSVPGFVREAIRGESVLFPRYDGEIMGEDIPHERQLWASGAPSKGVPVFMSRKRKKASTI